MDEIDPGTRVVPESGPLAPDTHTRIPSGKTTFFVANQANLDDMPAERLAALESEYKETDEENKQLVAETKMLSAGASMSCHHSFDARWLIIAGLDMDRRREIKERADRRGIGLRNRQGRRRGTYLRGRLMCIHRSPPAILRR